MASGVPDNNIFIGAGDVMVKQLDDPNAGFIPLGNCSSFTLTPKVVEIEDKSNMTDDWGNVIASMALPDGVDIAMTLTRFSKETWALALGAEVESLAQTSGEDASESLVLPHGQWVKLGKYKVSEVAVQEGSVSGVAGVDFIVKEDAGMVMSLATGSLTDGATCTVTYDHAAVADDAYKLVGGKVGSVEMGLYVDGINKYTGRRHQVEIFKASFSNTEAVQLITGPEKGTSSIKGKVVAESGQAGFEQVML